MSRIYWVLGAHVLVDRTVMHINLNKLKAVFCFVLFLLCAAYTNILVLQLKFCSKHYSQYVSGFLHAPK